MVVPPSRGRLAPRGEGERADAEIDAAAQRAERDLRARCNVHLDGRSGYPIKPVSGHESILITAKSCPDEDITHSANLSAIPAKMDSIMRVLIKDVLNAIASVFQIRQFVLLYGRKTLAIHRASRAWPRLAKPCRAAFPIGVPRPRQA
jgi:hypothetical protein